MFKCSHPRLTSNGRLIYKSSDSLSSLSLKKVLWEVDLRLCHSYQDADQLQLPAEFPIKLSWSSGVSNVFRGEAMPALKLKIDNFLEIIATYIIIGIAGSNTNCELFYPVDYIGSDRLPSFHLSLNGQWFFSSLKFSLHNARLYK